MKILHRIGVGLVLLGASMALVSAPGCMFRSCSLAGCVDGVTVLFSRTLQNGAFEIEVQVDSGRYQCAFHLEPGDSTPSDCRLGHIAIWRDRIYIESVPEKNVSVTLSQSGTIVGQVSFQPEYAESSPNGPECGPVCKYASHPMEVTRLPEDEGWGGMGGERL